MNTVNAQLRIDELAQRQSVLYAHSRQPGRLVVAISDVSTEGELARRIWSLAQARALGVLLFGICPTVSEQAELSRRLATIAAFLRLQNVAVDFRVEPRRDWLEQLKAAVNPSDEIACYVEDRPGLLRPPLSDVLSRLLAVPILDLSDYRAPKSSWAARLRHGAAWLGSILTIAGFLFLQIRVATVLQGQAQTAVLLLMLLPEVGLILVWNALMG